jgi:hypothetical protein
MLRTVVLRAVLSLMVVLPVVGSAAAQPIVTVRNRLVVLRDDNVVPIDLERRYLRVRVGTHREDPAHQVVLPLAGSNGDPTPGGATGGGATLTVYNANGGTDAVTYTLPADHWYRSPLEPIRVYQFKGDTTMDSAIRKIYVRPNKIYIEGEGSLLGYTLDEAAQGRVGVRLTLGTGVTFCIESVPRTPATVHDVVDIFRGATTAAPAVCPPLP